jgi:uncharacterized protein YceH (UPF0502 family)
MPPPLLSAAEARVLGVLIEKQRTVPDTYPLTLNALVAGCNQKSSREPILSLGDTDVQEALDALKGRSMIVETSGGRTMRYAHNAERALGLPSQSVALVAALLLRGPQTAGELRINTERMHRFADISTVEAFLNELAERQAGALVAELPRGAGARETRWTQLLSASPPPPDMASPGTQRSHAAVDAATPTHEITALREEIAALREEVAALREALETLRRTGSA